MGNQDERDAGECVGLTHGYGGITLLSGTLW